MGILTAAGLLLGWMPTGSLAGLLGTSYGPVLLAKVAAIAGLLGLAPLDKWRLVPASANEAPGA